MSIEYFQSNSSSSFPRCTEAKYAGNDDRLQIIDVEKNKLNINKISNFLGL
jgi:hypothetical protein